MRPIWDDIWMDLATKLAQRSECNVPDRNVGCVVVTRDNSSVEALGYNGGPAKIDYVCDFDPDVKRGSRCDCAHAEMNALTKLDSKNNSDLVLYVTLSPCRLCATLIVNAKCISEVVYFSEYRDTTPIFILRNAGIKVRRYYQ